MAGLCCHDNLGPLLYTPLSASAEQTVVAEQGAYVLVADSYSTTVGTDDGGCRSPFYGLRYYGSPVVSADVVDLVLCDMYRYARCAAKTVPVDCALFCGSVCLVFRAAAQLLSHLPTYTDGKDRQDV